MSSPTARTLNWLRKQGIEAGVVERHNTFSGQKIDLFGFIDIVALRPMLAGCLGVQATSAPNMAARRTKIISLQAAKLWLEAKNPIWVIGWSKKVKPGSKPSKKTGKRPKAWQPSVSVVTLEDFE